MKIFLSALGSSPDTDYTVNNIENFKWNLVSYYYVRNKMKKFKKIVSKSEEVLVDSGAHSFQKGKTVNWFEYTKEYAKWIKKVDNEKILGFFEMDVDNRIGYKKVLKLREILEDASDKIIPVWHKNRGIKQFKKMCKENSGGIVAITGFKNEDIKDDQYKLFLKTAWNYNCKLHCLGMTRTKILDKVPFDFVDSSSWKLGALFGRVGNKKVKKEYSKKKREKVFYLAYKKAMKKQKKYYNKWKGIKK